MRHSPVVAGATLALAFAASADAATIVSQASFGTTQMGDVSLLLPRYTGPGAITNVELSFRGESNQYFDVFGGDDPITLPELAVSWIIGMQGPGVDNGGGVIDFALLDETVVNAVYPEFEVPAGPGEQNTRSTPFMAVALDATDGRFGLYQGSGDNEFIVYGLGDIFIQARGTLTQTITIADPVPEPGTWALMLLGFGTAGAWLRRRRALAA